MQAEIRNRMNKRYVSRWQAKKTKWDLVSPLGNPSYSVNNDEIPLRNSGCCCDPGAEDSFPITIRETGISPYSCEPGRMRTRKSWSSFEYGRVPNRSIYGKFWQRRERGAFAA